jgi:hypothetical protein
MSALMTAEYRRVRRTNLPGCVAVGETKEEALEAGLKKS